MYDFFFSATGKALFEKVTFLAAIAIFILECIVIGLIYIGLLPETIYGEESLNAISIIYSPFSVILIYEVYLLIYYLPRSITTYIGKQYEVVALILVRSIFDTLSHLPALPGQMELLYEALIKIGGLLVLMLLIFCFYKLNGKKPPRNNGAACQNKKELNFISAKKVLAIALLLIFAYLFIKSLFNLAGLHLLSITGINDAIKELNNIFFSQFFTALIFTEVLLLLLTFNVHSCFNKVIRNSGFILSTILLKLSFRFDGIANILMLLTATAFGIAILGIYKLLREKGE